MDHRISFAAPARLMERIRGARERVIPGGMASDSAVIRALLSAGLDATDARARPHAREEA
jgi:hypothetical protein